jgi:hypothetical protein
VAAAFTSSSPFDQQIIGFSSWLNRCPAPSLIAAGLLDRREHKEITMRKLVPAAAAAMLLTIASPAAAVVVPFTGSVTGVSTLVGPEPACDPLPFQTKIDPASTVGTSPSFGSFTLETTTCIALGGGASFGTFTIDFGTDSFSGTFDGGSTPTTTPGISDTSWLYTILNGTGRFLGASGTLNASGTADATSRPTHVAINFSGDINAPALPEPASWALMILGFGGIGLAVRRRRERLFEQVA